MKNILKYSFSILIMLSCLIVFGIMAFKILVTDDSAAEAPGGEISNVEADGPKKIKPEDAHFSVADESYFNDALFIGDSRTMGLWEYGQLEGATFFANTGMSVYNINEKKVEVPGLGKVTLEQLLSKRTFGKVYVMLGINELGYNKAATLERYKELIGWLGEKNPDAIIYIEANLHVTAERSKSDDIITNENIDAYNEAIAAFIDNKKVFYIDVNEIFDDENGSLGQQYTSDSTHILGKYYTVWGDWILTKAILPAPAEENEEL